MKTPQSAKFLQFLLLPLFVLLLNVGWGQNTSVTITNASIGGSAVLGSSNYNSGAERTWTQSSINFGGKAITCNNSGTPTSATACQYIQAQATNGVIYNTTALPGRIVSVQFTGTASAASSCFGGTSRLVNATSANYTVGGTQIGTAQTNTTYTWSTAASDNYTFFCVQRGAITQYFSSIVITYQTPVAVTFNANSGTGTMTAQTAGVPTNLTSNTLTRTGYTFSGWNTAANGSGTSYADAASFPFTSATTLYAQWTATTTAPTLTTPTATSIATTSATLGATVTADGGATLTARGTVWGTAAAPTANALAEGSTTVSAFSHSRTSLTANTLYYYRGYATNSVGTSYSADGTFTTLPLAPTVGAGSSASTSGFTANWTAPTMGSVAYTYTVEVDDDNAFGSINSTVSLISSSSTSQAITGLSASTTYFYRVKAVNVQGSSVWSSTSTGIATSAASSPTLNAVTLTSALSTTYGTASSGVSFTASGSNLTGTITATAQTGYLVSSDNSTYTSSVSVDIGSTVYVAFSSTLAAGSYNGATAVVLSNTSAASNVNITTSASSNIVSPKAITVTGATATNRAYNGSTTVAVSGGSLSGVLSADNANVTLVGSPSGTVATASVGNSKVVTVTSYSISGSASANYSLTQPTDVTVNITQASLTITASDVSKVAGVALTGGAGSTAFTSSGLQNSETIGTVTIAYGTAGGATGDGNIAGVYASQVTPSAATGGTFTASNYSISYVAGSITVTAAPITLAAWNFFGESSPSTSTADVFNANFSSAPVLSRGADAATSTGSNSFRTVGFQNNGIATSNTDYFQTSITSTNSIISLSTLDAKVVGTATYCVSPGVSQQFAYSLDGINFTLIGSAQSTIGTPGTLTQIDLSNISALQNVSANTTITLRYYASGQTATGGWGFSSASASSSDDGFTIKGRVITAPILSTPTSASITTTSATLGATISSDGGASVTARGTVWGTAAAPTGNSLAASGTAVEAFSHSRTGLTANTLYYYRGYATNSIGTGYSADGTFTTLPLAPTVGSGSSASASGFTASWTAAAMGSATFTYTVEVDDDNAFGSVNATVSPIASSNTSAAITGLVAGTTYYYRVKAVNASGSSSWSSASVGFTTLSTDATLSALSLSSGNLNPVFASATITYIASVTNATTSITVTPTRNQANANIQVRVNGGVYSPVTSGNASGSLSLNVGDNTVNILVTAQDGSTTKTYTVTITRAATTPSAPTITSITPGNQQLSVAFSVPSSNGGASITNYEYSTNGGSSWTTPSSAITSSPFTISGLINGTTYDVQIRAVNSVGNGAASATTQGTPAAPSSPTISGAASASAFTTTYGTASAPQSFSISGSALTNDIIATAPTGFEVSSDGTNYATTANFAQSSGSVSSTLYIRLAATSSVSGTYNSQNIILSSTGASPVNITTAASGNTVAQKALAITTATVASKVYNRSTTCGTVTPGALSGFVGSETVVVSSAAGTYADWNVGTGKTATISYTLGNGTNGGLAANYSLANTAATGDITAKALTVTSPAVTSKTYDGNTNASITGSLSGVESGDAVTLTGTGTFATANVGTGISVTSTSTLGGADAGNYTLTQPTGLTGDINGASQTITFASLTPATLSTADYSPGATASSGLTVTYTSSNPCVATIVAGNIHIVGAGTTTITASQSGGGNYSAASSVNQTLVVQSSLNPTSALTAGDVVVIAYNTGGAPDNFALLFNADLAAGTVFYVNDNELASTSSTSFTDLAEMEASFTVKAGQTIAAGTVIVLPWGAAAVSATQYDWSSTSGAGLGGSNDELCIYTASSITATSPTLFISYAKIGTSSSVIPSSLTLGTTAIAPSAAALRYTTSGATYSGTKETLLTAIGNTSSNWNTTGATTFAASDWSFSVSPSPIITSTGTLSEVNTTYGTASASPKSFSVSASNLTADLTLTAPSGFEISSGSGYNTSLTISPNACGAIAATTINVRLAATTAFGTYSGNIVLSSTGATSVNMATASSSVSKKPLTIVNLTATDKIYDGLTTTTVSGTPAYSGLVNSESFSVSVTVSWAFPNATVENNKTLTRTGNYNAPSANYTVTQPTLTASITTRALTITANDVNKAYGDVLTGGSGSTAFSSSGLQNSEAIGSVTISYGNGSGAGDAVGTYSGQVTPSAALGGTFTAANYSISYVAGNIIVSNVPTLDPVALTSALSTTYGTASTGVSFVANGSNLSTNITVTAQSGYEVSTDNIIFSSSVLVASGTSVYVRFRPTITVGTYNNVLAAVLSSDGAANVNVMTSSSGNSVSAKALTISGISISNKIYDGNTSATITGTVAYSGLVNGESFTVLGTPSATFSDKNVGSNKTITVIGYTSPSSNYSFSQPSGLLANITTATLSVTSPAVTTKPYDGTTLATITGTLSGVISPDAVTLVGTGTFASANVGTGIGVTSTSTLGGADAPNYTLTQPTGLTGDITLKSLTITATDVSKEMGVLITGGAGSTAFTSSGLAASETIGSVTITYGAAAGTGATAGIYADQVTPSAATGGTFNADNYSITYSSGSITVSGFTPGNIVVNRIGNGSTPLTSAASAINVVELNTSGTIQQTISTLFTGTNLLTESGTGTSNGNLNSYSTLLGVPGYNLDLTTAGVSSSNTKATNILGTGATVVNRVVFPTSGSPLPFTGDNFRSIIPTSSTTFYASGNSSSLTGGIWYYNGTSYTQISTTQTNTRNVEIFNGNLYFSTGSGAKGIYQVGTGLPTSSGQTATLVVATASPYGFSLSPDGNTMYVADDGNISGNTGGGIQKWTKSGSTWTRQYTFEVQVRGLTVDYSNTNAVIYATTITAGANKIVKIIDSGSLAASSDVVLAGSNYVFRGVDFAPAAAPSAPTIGTVTQTTCSTSTGSVELTGLPSGQWRIYGFPSGTAVGTGSSTTISGLSAGSYTFLVTSYTGRTSEVSVSVTINAQPLPPSAPTATNASRCGAGTVTISATPGTIDWYSEATGGTLLESGSTSYTTPSISSTTTYYAEARNTTTGCVSSTRTAVTATVNTLLTASVSISASATTICSGTSVTFTATPTNGGDTPSYVWKINNSTVVGETASTYSTSSLVNGDVIACEMTSNSTSCLVSSSVNSNAVTMVVNALPTASITASGATSFCAGGNVTLTAGTSTSYLWSNNTTSASINVSTSGTYSVTVTNANGCSASASIIVTEWTVPTAGSTATSIACNGGTATVTVTGSGGTGAYTGTGNFTVSAGTHTYTVTDANGCTANTSITVTQPALVNTPTGTASQTFCSTLNATLASISVTGTAVQWYASNAGGSVLASTTPLVTGTTYYATQTIAGCQSPSYLSVAVTIPVAVTYYADADADGFGTAGVSQLACTQPTGYVSSSTDCRDDIPTTYPGAPELCNGFDDNCSGIIDEGCASSNACPTDLNADGVTNTADFLIFGPAFGTTCSNACPTDFNADGVTNTADFLIFGPEFGTSCN